ncbi:hypothetical protein PMAYCL1PPCAC_19999, partial [Pristionchus mayeri]
VKFLLEIASRVRSLRIKQNTISELPQNLKPLFGLIDADWESIIIEIFKRKVDKIMVENVYGTYLMDVLNIRFLESVSQMDKKIWFASSYGGHYESHDYDYNAYRLRVGKDAYTYNNTMDIKHISR